MNKILQIVQKYVFSTAIAVFGVLFIYGLIFATPVRSLVLYVLESGGNLIGSNPDKNVIASSSILKFLEKFPDALTIVRDTNSFCNQLLIIAIIGLVLTGICSLLRSQLRKKYYVTNYVFVGAFGLYSLGVFIYCFTFLTKYLNTLTSMNLEELNNAIPSYLIYPDVEGFSVYHIIGYVIFALVLLVAVCSIGLIVYKIITNSKKSSVN